MSASLVGSEMCIRDSDKAQLTLVAVDLQGYLATASGDGTARIWSGDGSAVSYTHLTLPTICSV
eukprot:9813265-Alexandrium_andersonii.AAC.1